MCMRVYVLYIYIHLYEHVVETLVNKYLNAYRILSTCII